MRYYRVDLRDLWRGGLSYRRLWALIKRLPPESWTQTALRDESLADLDDLRAPEPDPGEVRHGPWSHADYLMAQLLDAVRENTYATAIAGQLTPAPQPPEPTPRPGVTPQKATAPGMSEADFIFLNALRAPRG